MPSRKEPLSDRLLKALGPAPKGTRTEIRDTIVPGLMVRVTESGRKTFAVRARFGNADHATRRAIGEYGAITLSAAREIAKDWNEAVRRGRDPAAERKAAKQQHAEKGRSAFAAVVGDYVRNRVIGPDPATPILRTARDVERMLNVFVVQWGKRSIGDISRDDVETFIDKKAKTGPVAARKLLAILGSFYVWAGHQRIYRKAFTVSPCAGIKPSILIGDIRKRRRVLDDHELRAFVRNVERLRYPYGPVFRLLLLTLLRRNEAGRASWPEFNVTRGEWVIPAERMKGRNAKAVPHLVPITAEISALLDSLPRPNDGQFLFSTCAGAKPIATWSKVKEELDERMLRTLKACARKRGGDPDEVSLQNWTIHDIRRTGRSHLSAIATVSEETREALMAHIVPGVRGTYNVHDYLDEKRAALEAWHLRLRHITVATR
jgi:integrase